MKFYRLIERLLIPALVYWSFLPVMLICIVVSWFIMIQLTSDIFLAYFGIVAIAVTLIFLYDIAIIRLIDFIYERLDRNAS